MPLYRPSELRQLLQEIGAGPKKHLSQNFLLDGNIIKKIVRLADVSPDDLILEIGPGPGALTEALLATGASVVAIEKDKVFADALAQLDPGGTQLKVFCEDFLKWDLPSNIGPFLKGRKGKVIANLPYHLTTPIVSALIPMNHLFSRAVLMVQEEVARRFVAAPGSKVYGSITLFLKFYSTPEYGFRVSRNCFYPRPNVESAVVKFDLHSPPQQVDPERFFQLTRTAFGHRRKVLHNALEEVYKPSLVQEALNDMGKSRLSRPEELSLDEFIVLFNKLKN